MFFKEPQERLVVVVLRSRGDMKNQGFYDHPIDLNRLPLIDLSKNAVWSECAKMLFAVHLNWLCTAWFEPEAAVKLIGALSIKLRAVYICGHRREIPMHA